MLKIGGTPVEFLVDTGATYSVLTQTLGRGILSEISSAGGHWVLDLLLDHEPASRSGMQDSETHFLSEA